MRKIKTLILTILILTTSILSMAGCEKVKKTEQVETQVIFYPSVSVANAYIPQGNYYGLLIPYAYTGDYPEIEFVRAEGKNIETAQEFKVVVEESQSPGRINYNGYKYEDIGLIVSPGDKDVTVTDIVMKVNGEEKTIHFPSPATYKVPEYAKDVVFLTSPVSISAASTRQSVYTSIYAQKDVQITSIETYGPLSGIVTSINGNKNYTLPYTLKADNELEFEMDLYLDEDVKFCVGDIIVKYNDGEKENQAVCGFNSTGDEDDLNLILKNIVEGL